MISPELTKTVLFLCTGNTCRSPMAAAIAYHEFRSFDAGLTFLSSGIKAKPGAPITPEAGVALNEREILFTHKSRQLTKEALAQVDFVFAMEQRHIDAASELIAKLAPSDRPEMTLFSTTGPVPDPLGHSLDTYRKLADFLTQNIHKRLAEVGMIIPAKISGVQK